MQRFLASLIILSFATPLAAIAATASVATSAILSPTQATLSADEKIIFAVTAIDDDGQQANVTPDTTFSTNDPLGSFSGATYHPGKVGTWKVQASFQRFVLTSTITVTPGSVQEIVVNPNSEPEYIDRGATQVFTASAYDAASNRVPDAKISWEVIGPIGTISPDGVFTGKELGTGKIQASVGTILGQISAVVKEPEPASTLTNTAGTSANANASNGNTNQPVSNTNVPIQPNQTKTTTEECTTLSTWVWVVILIFFLLGVAILYALIPMVRIWPAVVGLGGAISLLVVQRSYGCDVLGWWGWVLALATLGMTILAMRQLPMPTPPSR